MGIVVGVFCSVALLAGYFLSSKSLPLARLALALPALALHALPVYPLGLDALPPLWL